MVKVSASCPGSCGELFQCVVDHQEYLLSYGIDERSYAKLSDLPIRQSRDKMKIAQALNHLENVKRPANLISYSELPVGKGYSSSSADMLSALKICSQEATAVELTKICAQVEPTDSVAFKDWTVLNPLTGQVIWQTKWKPSLYVYILEPIATVETLGLARMTESKNYPRLDSSILFDLFQEACRTQNLQKIGFLATLSSLMNNKRLPKPYLLDVLALSTKHRCLGVNVAHSGTLVGILLGENQVDKLDTLEKDIQESSFASYYQYRKLSQIVYEGVRVRKE